MRDGRCDLGIASIDPYALYADGLEERIVWRDELVVVVPTGHPWEQLEEIPAEEFAVEPDWCSATPGRTRAGSSPRRSSAWAYERVPPTAAIGSTAGVIAMAEARRACRR